MRVGVEAGLTLRCVIENAGGERSARRIDQRGPWSRFILAKVQWVSYCVPRWRFIFETGGISGFIYFADAGLTRL